MIKQRNDTKKDLQPSCIWKYTTAWWSQSGKLSGRDKIYRWSLLFSIVIIWRHKRHLWNNPIDRLLADLELDLCPALCISRGDVSHDYILLDGRGRTAAGHMTDDITRFVHDFYSTWKCNEHKQNVTMLLCNLKIELLPQHGIFFLVLHCNLIFQMAAIQNIFCVAIFLHRTVQTFV